VLVNPTVQLKIIELLLHLQGVNTGMALYSNANVLWLRIHLIPTQMGVNLRGQWIYYPQKVHLSSA